MKAFPQLALGQVETRYPAEFAVGCVFPNLAQLGAIRVRLTADLASPETGHYSLPDVNQWGLVAFYQDDPRSAVWIKTIPDELWNTNPLEILSTDPDAVVRYLRTGTREIDHSNGDRERVFADGSVLRFTHSKDGSISNAGGRAKVTPMKRTENAGKRRAERRDYAPPALAPLDVLLQHASGAQVLVTADGSIELKTAKGHKLRLYDSAEKARDPENPLSVTAVQDAPRDDSGIYLETEKGHKITVKDNMPPAKGIITVQHRHGDKVEIIQEQITVQTVNGETAVLEKDRITLTAKTVNVNADTVNLAGGGAAVARKGDLVTMSNGLTGTITEGSAKVNAG